MLNCLVTHIIITIQRRKIPPDRWYNDSYPGENIRNDAQTALFDNCQMPTRWPSTLLERKSTRRRRPILADSDTSGKVVWWFLKKEKNQRIRWNRPDGGLQTHAANTYYLLKTCNRNRGTSDRYYPACFGLQLRIGRMVNVGFSGYF